MTEKLIDETEPETDAKTVATVAAAAGKKGMLTLGQCGPHDFASPYRGLTTGWGKICKDRHDRGISRKQRRLKKQAQASN